MTIQGNKPEKRSHELPATTISAPKYQKNLTVFICYIKFLSTVTIEKFWSIKISSLLLLKVSGTFQTVFSIKTHLEIFLRELVAFKGFLKVIFFILIFTRDVSLCRWAWKCPRCSSCGLSPCSITITWELVRNVCFIGSPPEGNRIGILARSLDWKSLSRLNTKLKQEIHFWIESMRNGSWDTRKCEGFKRMLVWPSRGNPMPNYCSMWLKKIIK